MGDRLRVIVEYTNLLEKARVLKLLLLKWNKIYDDDDDELQNWLKSQRFYSSWIPLFVPSGSIGRRPSQT